mgnify:CR=1 FL=1
MQCEVDFCPGAGQSPPPLTLDSTAPMFAEVFTGSPGKLVDLESTIKGFAAICNGEYDHLPEAAFYMVGTIEEAVEKAEKMAKDAAA